MGRVSTIKNFGLIIGAMKCGTTSLFEYLAEHPQVAACRSKEPNFFTHQATWNKGFNEYCDLWDYDPNIHTLAIEASVNYTKLPRLPNAAARIFEISQQQKVNFKFIYIIRNPFERIASHCTHDLEEQWAKKYNQKVCYGIPYPAIEASKYAMQMDAYYHYFPREDILIIDFEDLKKDSQSLLKKVCHFLDIDHEFEFQSLSKPRNPSQGKPITSPFWVPVDKYLATPAIRLLPIEHRLPVMNFVRGCFKTGIIKGNIKLSDEQKEFIIGELKDDLIKLRTKYGINTTQWGLEY